MRRGKPTAMAALRELWFLAAKQRLKEEIVQHRPRIVTIGPMQVFHIREIAAELPSIEFSWFVDHDCHDLSWVFDEPRALAYLT